MPGVPQNLKGRSFTRVGSLSRDDLEMLLETPARYEPDLEFVATVVKNACSNGGSVEIVTDPAKAVRRAHATVAWCRSRPRTACTRRRR